MPRAALRLAAFLVRKKQGSFARLARRNACGVQCDRYSLTLRVTLVTKSSNISTHRFSLVTLG